ncbi:hypothetical protein PBY51_020195 [Eleginops maclovinus]|uniref:Uncharacterized protein n=1 Tax=Eleginops maclovinus TaxID=56733 RepID=A0AAN7XLC3_ELEMC|nr:hypothetical protein PBY51_020195 [Eleginops maclovinus]
MTLLYTGAPYSSASISLSSGSTNTVLTTYCYIISENQYCCEVQQSIIELVGEGRRTGGEGGKTEEVWLLVITALPAVAYNSSLSPLSPLPSLLTTHPAPYLRTTAPQSPPFSNPIIVLPSLQDAPPPPPPATPSLTSNLSVYPAGRSHQ